MYLYVFFFKQKSAYEVRISDLSSDVCSSDLHELTDAHPLRLRLVGVEPELGDGCGGLRLLELGGLRVLLRQGLLLQQRVLDPELGLRLLEIGRASCRERVCQSV